MNCQQVEPLLGSFLEGPAELSEREFGDVGRHVEACRTCTEHLDEMRWVIEQVKAQPRVTAPADLAQKLHMRLALEGKPRKFGVFEKIREIISWPSLATGAAVAAAVMFIVLRGPQPIVAIQASAVPLDRNVSVQIAFDVGEDVQDVTFDIKLQEGLKFVDGEGQPISDQQVTWKGELKRGKTVIPVMVRGIRPGRFEILAVVRKNQLARETRIIIPVMSSKSGAAAANGEG